ncbi:uncharacterized protein LOC144133420 isoform X2 [Amblyomma americanum]
MTNDGTQAPTPEASATVAQTPEAVDKIPETSAAAEDVTSGPREASESKPEAPLPRHQTASTPQQQRQAIEDALALALLDDELYQEELGPRVGGGGIDNQREGILERARRRLMDDEGDSLTDGVCGDRCWLFNRAFGLPLAGLAFITIFLPISIHRYGFAPNDTLQRKATAESVSYSTPSSSTKRVNLETPGNARHDSATADNSRAPVVDSREVYNAAYEADGPYINFNGVRNEPTVQTRRFFETRSTGPTDAGWRTRDIEDRRGEQAENNGRVAEGGSGREGGRGPPPPPGAGGGQPVPPLRGSQLWCVYRPPSIHDLAAADDDEYQLDDVPVSLCTAVVYCCLDLWRHGVRMYPHSPDESPGVEHGEYNEGDGGPQGIYHFNRLRTRRGTPQTLRLYAMLGGRDQTTWNFARKMAPVDHAPGDDDVEADGQRSRRQARRQDDGGAARQGNGDSRAGRGALWSSAGRPVNYTVLDRAAGLSARWLQRLGLDGFVFNYRTDPHYPRADAVYLLHFRAFHERLTERGFHAALVLPDAVTTPTTGSGAFGQTGSGGTDRKRGRSGATSVARLVATGYTPLVLPTHDLVPQDRKLHGRDEAASDQQFHDAALPPPHNHQGSESNATSAATCPAPYSSDDPALLTQERMLAGRYGKLTVTMKLNTLVTVSFKADHYRLRNQKLFKELTPAYKVGQSSYRDMCRLANGSWPRRPGARPRLADPASTSSRRREATRSFYGPRSACLVVQSQLDWYSGFGPESARPLLLDGPGSGFLGVVAFDLEADDFTGACGGAKHPLVRRLRRMLWLNEQRRQTLPRDAADDGVKRRRRRR